MKKFKYSFLSVLSVFIFLFTISCFSYADNEKYYIASDNEENVLAVGQAVSYHLYTKENQNLVDSQVVWLSSSPMVASVTSEGIVSAKAPGKAIISCTAASGSSVLAKLEITVSTPVSDITVSEKELTLYVGLPNDEQSVSTLFYSVMPEDTNYKKCTWSSSDTDIVSVTPNGTIRANSPGCAVIYASSSDPNFTKKAECKVTVLQAVEELKLENEKTIYTNTTEPLFAEILPESSSIKKLNWSSSDEEIVTVDENGKVTGRKSGKATVTCSTTDASNLSATCVVNVISKVNGLVLSDSSVSLYIGLSQEKSAIKLSCTTVPVDAYYQDVVWATSDETIATVDSNGLVNAVGVGKAEIYATSTDPNYQTPVKCSINVLNAVSAIQISSVEETLYTGTSVQLSAVAFPEDATDNKLVWVSDNPDIAAVDSNGKVTAKAVGKANVICQSNDGGGTSVQCEVNVIAKVQSLSLSEKEITLLFGAGDEKLQKQLICTTVPEDAFCQEFTWVSSDESVATVDDNGMVHAVGFGEALITVTSNDPECKSDASCKVSCQQAVMVLELKSSTDILYLNETTRLETAMSPENAANQKLIWTSSDDGVATVNSDGLVTAKAVGTVVITCTTTDGSELSSSTEISVRAKVKGLSLSEKECTLLIGSSRELSTRELKCTTTPENAFCQDFLWTSDDESIAKVDSNGVISGISPGKTTISVVSNDPSYTIPVKCNVTVGNAVTDFEFKDDKVQLEIGQTAKLSVDVFPENAFNSKLKWESDAETLVSVDQNGNVRALNSGYAVITCTTTDGTNISKNMVVETVQKVKTLKLSSSKVLLFNNQSGRLNAVIGPENATNQSLSWSSSSNSVSVSSTGNITANSVGKATVTCTTTDGSNLSASANVVVEPTVPVEIVDAGNGIFIQNLIGFTFQSNCREMVITDIYFDLEYKTGLTWILSSEGGTYHTGQIYLTPGSQYEFKRTLPGSSKGNEFKLTITDVVFSDGTKYSIPSKYQNTVKWDNTNN